MADVGLALGPDDLVLAHWTMASATFEERCIAAAAGGFAGFGILPDVYLDARRSGLTDVDLRAMVESYGVRMSQLEAVSIAGPDTEALVDSQLAVHWHLADLFGARELGVVGRPGHDRHRQLLRFRKICDDAAPRGIIVGVEFIQQVARFESIRPTLHFVCAAARDNGGLILDSFHHFRGANDWGQLDELPGWRVMMIQLSDALMPPECGTYLDDTVHRRRIPGDGSFPLQRFIRTLDAKGVRCPITVEVLSDELASLGPEEQGRRLGEGTRSFLQAARASRPQAFGHDVTSGT